MSNDSLSAQSLQTVRGLYAISPEFRNQFDQLMTDGVSKAKKLVAELSKLSLDGKADTTTVEAPKKTRGRPKGSKNSQPSKPRAKKEKPAAVESVVTSAHTHADAIRSVIPKDGLTAGEIHTAIMGAKIPGYTPPQLKTLYTSLSNMKSKGALKTVGIRPNVKYILP